jgi:hypothetical protein
VVFCEALVEPDPPRFRICFKAVFGIALEVCHIEPVFGKLVNFGQKLPSVFDRLFLTPDRSGLEKQSKDSTDLKVVAKRPVTKHLKKCMMIRIFANVFQI